MDFPSTLGPYTLHALLLETASAHLCLMTRPLPDGGISETLVGKVYKTASDAFAQDAALRAQAVNQAHLVHLLGVLDVGKIGNQVVVVRRQVRGFTLAQLREAAAASKRTVTPSQALRMVLDVLLALQAAHAQTLPQGPLAHGEVSPDHVMVEDSGNTVLLGAESPRATALEAAARRLDLAAACALLYDLLAPRKAQGDGWVMPPALAQVITAAMGIRGAKHKPAAELIKAMEEAALVAGFGVATRPEVAALVRRLQEDAQPPQPLHVPPAHAKDWYGPTPVVGGIVDKGGVYSPPPQDPPRREEATPQVDLHDLFAGASPTLALVDTLKVPAPAYKLEDLLVHAGRLTLAQRVAVLAQANASGVWLGQAVVEMRLMTEDALANSLCEFCNAQRMPDEDLLRSQPSWQLRGAIPGAMAVESMVMPLHLDPATGVVTVAMVDPFASNVLKDVQLRSRAQSAVPVVVTASALMSLLRGIYPQEFPMAVSPPAPPSASPAGVPGSTAAVLPAPLASPGRAPPSQGNVILLCEPDAALAQSLTQRLQAEQWEVINVGDGLQARAAVERYNPTAIIAEAALPKLDGMTLLLGVRSRDASRELPFFLLSARRDEQQAAKAVELGADDLFTKPVNLDLLIGKIRRAMASYVGRQARDGMAGAVTASLAEPPGARTASGAWRGVAPRAADPLDPAAGKVDHEPTGVSGSLQQMTLPDVVQSLELGRKTAVVNLTFQDKSEGVVLFVEGEVVNATYGALKGEDAFYKMSVLRQGYFRIHYTIPEDTTRVINVSTTFLLLEAMRRVDQAVASWS